MKAKLFMILLVVLFIVPISGAVNKPRKRPVLLRKHETRKNVLPRIPIDYTIDVSNNDNCLQILFQFPLHESDITVADNKPPFTKVKHCISIHLKIILIQ